MPASPLVHLEPQIAEREKAYLPHSLAVRQFEIVECHADGNDELGFARSAEFR